MEGGDSAGNGPDNENAPSVFQTSHSSLALPEPVGPRHPSLPSRTIYLQTAPVGRSRTSRTIWSWAANGRPILTRTVEAQRSPCSSNSCGNLERYHRYSPRVRQVGRCHDSRKSKEGGGETHAAVAVIVLENAPRPGATVPCRSFAAEEVGPSGRPCCWTTVAYGSAAVIEAPR